MLEAHLFRSRTVPRADRKFCFLLKWSKTHHEVCDFIAEQSERGSMTVLKGSFTQNWNSTHLLFTLMSLEPLVTVSNLHNCSWFSHVERIPPNRSLLLPSRPTYKNNRPLSINQVSGRICRLICLKTSTFAPFISQNIHCSLCNQEPWSCMCTSEAWLHATGTCHTSKGHTQQLLSERLRWIFFFGLRTWR